MLLVGLSPEQSSSGFRMNGVRSNISQGSIGSVITAFLAGRSRQHSEDKQNRHRTKSNGIGAFDLKKHPLQTEVEATTPSAPSVSALLSTVDCRLAHRARKSARAHKF